MQQVVYIIYSYSNILLPNWKMNLNRIPATVNHYRNRFHCFDMIYHRISEAIASRPWIFMKIYALIWNEHYFVAWREICFVVK